MVALAESSGCPYGLIPVSETPDWFQEKILSVGELAETLEKALEAGPVLIPPQSPAFTQTLYLDTGELNEARLSRVAQGLQILARKEWAEGAHKKAIQYLSDMIRLADALAPRLASHSQSIRLLIYSNALRGFDALTWTNPDPEQNRLILKALERIRPQDWTGPPHMDALIVSGYAAPETTLLRGGADAWVTARLQLAYDPGKNYRTNPDVQEVYRGCGFLPGKPLTRAGVLKHVMEWTTVPAMKRRAKRIPASFFEEDPLLSAQAARALPRLAYLASRLYEPYRQDPIEGRIDSARAHAYALLATYRARCWRDEHNRWPNSEEFAQLVPQGANLQWMEIAPTEVTPAFKQMHEADKYRHHYTTTDINRFIANDHNGFEFAYRYISEDTPDIKQTDEEAMYQLTEMNQLIANGLFRIGLAQSYIRELTNPDDPSVVYVNVGLRDWGQRIPTENRKGLVPQHREMVSWIKAVLEANTALVEKVVPIAVYVSGYPHPDEMGDVVFDSGTPLEPAPPTHRVVESLGRADILEVHLRVPQRCYYMLRSPLPGQDKVPRTEDQPLSFGYPGHSYSRDINGPFRIPRYAQHINDINNIRESDIVQLTGWD